MEIEKQENKIVIKHNSDFDIEEILNSGQVFSYYKTSDNSYVVISGDKFADIIFSATQTTIKTDYVDFFYNYFDLDMDYKKIQREILKLQPDFGKFFFGGNSIRILNQEPLQTIISFIVSANNNIKRIKNFLTNMSERFGERLPCGYYSFPNLSQLKKATLADFNELKAGYRGAYLVDTIQKLDSEEFNIQTLQKLSTKELKTKLITLRGIGPKVAECILLFSFKRSDVFPVDTWIRKSFSLFSNETKNDLQIEKYFLDIFKEYSGFAQQYLYNYMLHKNH